MITQHTEEYGGDGSWYAGAILTLHEDSNTATIIYDDGEEWTARLRDEVFVLQGGAQDEEEGGHPSEGAVALLPTQPAAAAVNPDRSR